MRDIGFIQAVHEKTWKSFCKELTKVFKLTKKEKQRQKDGFAISKTVDIEWGNQIRTYTLHPYKMIKDHRTGVEIHNTDDVLLDGELSLFIEAERDL